MKKRAIRSVPRPGENRAEFDAALKENLEIITGARGGAIRPLDADASLEDAVAKINEILARMQ